MTRFACLTVPQEGETLYELRDQQSGAYARIWPAFGCNCLAAALPAQAPSAASPVQDAQAVSAPAGGALPASDAVVELLHAPDTLATLRAQPSWWGVPILFPWPGRIPGGQYVFGGQRHQLPVLDMGGNAGHGFVKTRAWMVVQSAATAAEAFLECSISSEEYPDTLKGFPFPYRLTVRYTLRASTLSAVFRIENTGPGELPFGLGVHPYFRAPLAEAGSRDRCLVTIPADTRWRLQNAGQIVPGAPVRREDVLAPVAGDTDLRKPVPINGRAFDGVYSGLSLTPGTLEQATVGAAPPGSVLAGYGATPDDALSGGTTSYVECSVLDPAAGLEAVLRASDNFGCIVFYTPPDRPSLCFEPWTCPPNVFNLAAGGLDEAGLLVLPPGGAWTGQMDLFVRTAPSPGPLISR